LKRTIIVLTIVLSFAWLGQSKPRRKTFDLSADFSLEKNPDGVWQFGYSSGQSLDPKDFRVDESNDKKVPIGFWHPAANQGPGPGYYPYVAFNRSVKTEYGSSNGWAARGGQIAMEGSNTGQYAVVRFIVPASGQYEISAQFEGIHFGLSTTDVHVVRNGTSLFDADIEGYGGDAAFHKVEGAQPSAKFSQTIALKAHDIVDFAVGYGKNKTHFGDTTGLFAEIKPVGKNHGH
jgi:hypothetical protein